MTSVRNQLIADYLQQLNTASTFLTPARRAELRQEIQEHIDAAMDEVETLDADAVRAVLDRLGPPAAIVAAELGTRSTGSIPVVKAEPTEPQPTPITAAPAAAPTATQPPTYPPFIHPQAAKRSTRRTLLISGAAAVALLGVVMVFGFAVTDGSSQQYRPNPVAPAESSTSPTPPPEDPSQTPSQPEQTPTQSAEPTALPPTPTG